MNASLAKGMPQGFEVGYGSFTINGRMLGSGEPIRVKQGERVLFHVLNGSATEIRSLALPGHTFTVVALDGNPIPMPVTVPGLWLGTAERVSAIVEMNQPGVWIHGRYGDDDRQHGMGMVVEYAGQKWKPQWVAPSRSPTMGLHPIRKPGRPHRSRRNHRYDLRQAQRGRVASIWTINGRPYAGGASLDVPFADGSYAADVSREAGARYRLRMRNASDDIHPIHLHRHQF